MLWVWNYLLKYVAGEVKNNYVQVIIELFTSLVLSVGK